MKRYIALLRGINISGKNKVPMDELKQGFEKLNYTEIKTYLNSGNVIFQVMNLTQSSLQARLKK